MPPSRPVREMKAGFWPDPYVENRAERARSASDIDLFRYCQGVIYFDAQISDGEAGPL